MVAASEEERAKSEVVNGAPLVTDQWLVRQTPTGLTESLLPRVGGRVSASSREGMGLGPAYPVHPPPLPPPWGRGGRALSDRVTMGKEGTPRRCLFFTSPRTQASHMLTRLIVSLGA